MWTSHVLVGFSEKTAQVGLKRRQVEAPACRIQMPSGAWAQDCDDDGENAAGGRMLHLLQVRFAIVRLSATTAGDPRPSKISSTLVWSFWPLD